MQCKVLVIGGNHQNTLGVIEALGQKGVSSHVIILGDSISCFVLKSKYVEFGWICKEEEVVTCILEHFSAEVNKVVTITCCDDAATIIDSKGFLSYPNCKRNRNPNNLDE